MSLLRRSVSRRSALVLTVILTTLVTLATVVFPTADASARPPIGTLPVLGPLDWFGSNTVYFALGDSYASGEGNLASNYTLPSTMFTPAMIAAGYDLNTDTGTNGNTCHRSTDAYAMLASPRPATTTRFVACSGAVINNVFGTGQSGEPPQAAIFDLEPNTTGRRVISISIGGNDLGFGSLLGQCIVATACDTDPAIVGGALAMLSSSSGLQADLENVYRDIFNYGPNAQVDTEVFVVGYPKLFGDFGLQPTCDGLESLYDSGERRFADILAARLNNRVRAAVGTIANEGHKIHFVPVLPTFVGKEVCTGVVDPDPALNTRWINSPVGTSEISHWFHPNAQGHAAIANRIDQPWWWS